MMMINPAMINYLTQKLMNLITVQFIMDNGLINNDMGEVLCYGLMEVIMKGKFEFKKLLEK